MLLLLLLLLLLGANERKDLQVRLHAGAATAKCNQSVCIFQSASQPVDSI